MNGFTFFLGIIVGLIAGGYIQSAYYRNMAVNSGAGYYRPQDGEFQWRTNLYTVEIYEVPKSK